MDDKGFVRSSIINGIGIIEFYHPKSNSMSSHLLHELTENIDKLGREPSVIVIVLKSKGDRAFCAGASFDELLGIQNFEEGKAFFMGFAHVILAIRNCPKFIIGRVQGKAVGGGVGLLAATDYCFALECSSIRLSELALGIGPFVIEPALKRKIGVSAMSELTLNATQWKSSKWAKKHGLFNEICPGINQLDEKIMSFAHDLSTKSIPAIRELKKMFWENTVHWDALLEKRAEISAKLALSKDTRKVIEAFKKER